MVIYLVIITNKANNSSKIGSLWHFTREDIHMANILVKKHTTALIIRIMLIKTAMRYHIG